jgi:hypothetical protein
MAETTYDLVFRAELLPEGDGANARSTLARVLKLDDTRLQQLFSGGVVYVRRGVDRDTAVRFQAAFRQAGARLRVIPLETSTFVEPPAPAASTAAADASDAAPLPRKPSLAERIAAQQSAQDVGQDESAVARPSFGAAVSSSPPTMSGSAAPAAPEAEEDHGGLIDFVPSDPVDRFVAAAPAATNRPTEQASGSMPPDAETADDEEMIEFTLAPVGADLIQEEEREVKAEVRVSVEHIALAPPGGTIPVLHPRDEIRATVKIPDFDVAEAGALLAELTEFVELPLDLDAYSLAPPGATLGPAAAQAPALDPEMQQRLAQMKLAPVGSEVRGSARP